MVDIVLAAGYATRLYPLTENFPKPLLPIGGGTLLDRIMADLDGIPGISRHVIVCNRKFVSFFEKWRESARCSKPVAIVDDGSTDNEHRVGAVRDLLLAMDRESVDEDMLVVAADNVLDFSFSGFIDFAEEKKASSIMCHYEPSVKALRKTGVVCLDDCGKVVLMEEKPRTPKSNWAVPPFYVYLKKDFPLIRSALENGCGYDAPGNLAHYLCGHTDIYAYKMPGRRYDIGDLESYEAAKHQFGK